MNRHGYTVYSLVSLVLAAAAFLSWHLVEKPSLKLKDLGLRRPPRTAPQGNRPPAVPGPGAAEPVAETASAR
ncbi:hypothetical protein ABZW30_45420 [Kitasatospora sp. NPDC004669]|uniref:hypothetical protein n=1 Tax=Kitasatospora sp. NPDC004669 TaxID=3154555 RepID=UPI0033BD7E63